MPHYLLRYRLTPEAWNALVKSPQDLHDAARQVVEATTELKLHYFWYAFAEHDCYILLEGDRNVDVAVIAAGLTAGGGLRLVETRTLFTVDEMWEVLYRTRELLRSTATDESAEQP
jgi:uncharacterized protein with GYD domain